MVLTVQVVNIDPALTSVYLCNKHVCETLLATTYFQKQQE